MKINSNLIISGYSSVVERDLAKVDVACSSHVTRLSIFLYVIIKYKLINLKERVGFEPTESIKLI